MGRSDPGKTGPGSIDETVARLAVWARRAPRGFAHVEYHSEFARAEADRRLGEVLSREQVPYHHIDLPVRVTPSQAGRYLAEHLERIETGTVSITGLATAVADEDRRGLLEILSVRREVLAEFGLRQIWWLTPDFRDALLHIAPDLDSWFMVRLKLEEVFVPASGIRCASEPAHWPWPKYPIDEALQQATGLVERFQRARQVQAGTSEFVAMGASIADAIVAVGAPNLTMGLAYQLVSGLTEACQGPLAECLPAVRDLNRLAHLLIAHGRSRDAEPLIERAWARIEQGEGRDDPDAARNLHDLAGLYRDIDRPDRAESLYREAIAILEEGERPGYLSLADCLKSLARMLRKAGRVKEAEALYRRAVAVNEERLGPDHPDVAIDLENLAVLLGDAGRLTEAEPLFRRALANNERWFGPDDPTVAYDLRNLAELLRARGDLNGSEAMLRRALAIDEPSLGPDHPAVARDLANLAALLGDAGRRNEAEPLVRRALAIDERIYPPDHPSVVRDRRQLASLLEAEDRVGEAETLPR
ncbi:MAG: tetratricopeptide repeat protein [Isosphaeraceae bacterium]